jgi:DNA-directed RNA polymerase subunit RPC12/RpoP
MIIAQECADCGEVFEEDFEESICPFCQGKIVNIIEYSCRSCGRIFEGSETSTNECPYCESNEIEDLD